MRFPHATIWATRLLGILIIAPTTAQPATPRRIISLTPSNTEILFAIGAGPRVVGVTTMCNFPVAAKRLRNKIGDYKPNIEKILSLKPDLVVAHTLLNAAAIRSLKKFGIRVFAGDPKTLEETMRFIIKTGEVTGHANKAREIVRAMRSKIASVVKNRPRSPERPRVLMSAQFSPLFIAGARTFMDELCRLAGGHNIGTDHSGAFYQISVETILVRDPQVILAAHHNTSAYSRSPQWRRVSAVKSGRVHEIDSDIFTRPGPRLADALVIMSKLLHPR